jgi:hypothetical protein
LERVPEDAKNRIQFGYILSVLFVIKCVHKHLIHPVASGNFVCAKYTRDKYNSNIAFRTFFNIIHDEQKKLFASLYNMQILDPQAGLVPRQENLHIVQRSEKFLGFIVDNIKKIKA